MINMPLGLSPEGFFYFKQSSKPATQIKVY